MTEARAKLSTDDLTTQRVDERESGGFLLTVPRKPFDQFSELLYFCENRPVYFFDPFDQWVIFGYDDDADLFNDPRISADRVKGFVDATPSEPKWRRVSPSKPPLRRIST